MQARGAYDPRRGPLRSRGNSCRNSTAISSGSGSDLALGTQERAAAVGLDPHDGAAAAAAGLALAVVDLVQGLELPDLAEQVAVLLVGERGPSVLDGLL